MAEILKYYYKEDTNTIYFSGSQDAVKVSTLHNDTLGARLVSLNNAQTYSTLEGIDITLRDDNELWVYRGEQDVGALDANAWRYNRYLHRPYKAYIVTQTGSGDSGLPYRPYDVFTEGGTIYEDKYATLLKTSGNNLNPDLQPPIDSFGPLSGSFTILNSNANLWIHTVYNKLKDPSADGAKFSISQSDGTPVGFLQQSQGFTLNDPLFSTGLTLTPGNYIYTSSQFDNTGNTGLLAVGYTRFGLWSSTAPTDSSYTTKVEKMYLAYSSSISSSENGMYRFKNVPFNDLSVTSSVYLRSYTSSDASIYGQAVYGVDTYGEGVYGGKTWPTASLRLYKGSYPNNIPGTLIAEETITGDSLHTGSRITLHHSLAASSVSLDDTLKVALFVTCSGIDPALIVTSSLLATEYTMSISSSVPDDGDGSVNTEFDSDNNFYRAYDCQPLLNNYENNRLSGKFFDVDYSTNILTPINFDLILARSASYARVQDSNYSSLPHILSRYLGDGLIGDRINIWQPGDSANLGKVPVIESKNAYIGYFSRVVDPYPTLNNKTAYYIKYLIDRNGDLYDPALSDANYYNLIGTYTPNSEKVNNQIYPTNASGIVNNPDTNIELKDLEQFSPVYVSGLYPTPILYSQTSSNQYDVAIPLTGSGYLSNIDSGYSDYAVDAYGEISNTAGTGKSGAATISTTTLSPPLATSGSLATQSYDPSAGDGVFFFVNDANTPNPPAGDGKELSDNYTIEAEYIFYTTGLPYRYYRSGWPWNRFKLADDELGYFTMALKRSQDGTNFNETLSIDVVDVKLEILTNIGDSVEDPVILEVPALSTSNFKSWNTPSAGSAFRLNFNGSYLRESIQGAGGTDDDWIARPGSPSSNPVAGTRKYKWTVKLRKRDSVQLVSGDYLRWEVNGNIDQYSGKEADNDYYYAREGYQRGFFPDVPSVGNDNGKALTNINISGDKTTTAQQFNQGLYPYFVISQSAGNFVPDTLICTSSVLNQAYGQNYYQGDIPYTPGPNPDFPFNKEPDFIRFEPIRNPWRLRLNDEIRFENNENKAYRIKDIILPSSNINEPGQLKLKLDGNVEPSTDVNFFLIRRFENSKNFVILNQQKPYGVPVTASSAPGLLRPEFVIDELAINPDVIFKDLIDKKIID